MDSVCLDCNDPINVTVKDGGILSSIPEKGIVGVSIYGFGFLGGGDTAGRN
ncbi:MAG: hypothetical protein CL900_04375 [Dehalococcoidia bacterium]|nr:hypothetical protein [Dehalococcoidia bacterium]